MKTVIIGDSFVSTIKDTWIESLRIRFDLDIVAHKSFMGGSEYYIYEYFTTLLAGKKVNFDLVIFSHTEPSRLPNARGFNINALNATSDVLGKFPPAVKQAAKMYYEELYHQNYHSTVYNLLVKEIQSLCSQLSIKQIHLEGFDIPAPRQSGLWVSGGLHNIARLGSKDYYKDASLLNHFDTLTHKKFSDWLIPRVENYFAIPAFTVVSLADNANTFGL